MLSTLLFDFIGDSLERRLSFNLEFDNLFLFGGFGVKLLVSPMLLEIGLLELLALLLFDLPI